MMKNYNICDDILLEKISSELAHIGCFVPVSEIEHTVIACYDRITEAYATSNHRTITIDKANKDETYYKILMNAACADIISRSRLSNARNGYEVTSILSILQGYLDGIAKAAHTELQRAPEIFSEILQKLKCNVVIVNTQDGWQTGVDKDFELSVGNDINSPSCNAIEVPIKKSDYPPVCHLCNNKITNGPFLECSCTDDEDSCWEYVNVSIAYRGMCFGFKVDPVMLLLDRPVTSSRSDLMSRAKVFKNFLNKANKEFKDNLLLIYTLLCTHHERTESEE